MKNVALITVLISGVVFSATAQNRAHKSIKDVPEIAKERTERLTNQLGLSEDQQREVYALNLEKAEQMKATYEARAARMAELKKERAERVEEMRVRHEAEQERLAGILTEEQREKLAQHQSERMEKRKETRSRRNTDRLEEDQFNRAKKTVRKSGPRLRTSETPSTEK